MKYVEFKIRLKKEGGDGGTVDIFSAFNPDMFMYIWEKEDHTLIRMMNEQYIEVLMPYKKVLEVLNERVGNKGSCSVQKPKNRCR